MVLPFCCSGRGRGRDQKNARLLLSKKPGKYLATTYSRGAFRPTTIGAATFHFRVRNGTGWFHYALVTRGRVLRGYIHPAHGLQLPSRQPLPDIHVKNSIICSVSRSL